MGRFETPLADGGKERVGFGRSLRPMDRSRSWQAAAPGNRSRHGFERQPDPWRAGDERLEWLGSADRPSSKWLRRRKMP